MQPPAEHVHWLFATGFLLLGLCLLAEAVVGTEVWRRRAWRAYLWPGIAFALGVLLWPVMVLYTNSTIHMIAHGAWAQVLMLGAATELGLVRGQARGRWRRLGMQCGERAAPADAPQLPRYGFQVAPVDRSRLRPIRQGTARVDPALLGDAASSRAARLERRPLHQGIAATVGARPVHRAVARTLRRRPRR